LRFSCFMILGFCLLYCGFSAIAISMGFAFLLWAKGNELTEAMRLILDGSLTKRHPLSPTLNRAYQTLRIEIDRLFLRESGNRGNC
ncbi:MAG: hypothetical protein ACFB10_14920, partial [Salibacteraceae bacterium]